MADSSEYAQGPEAGAEEIGRSQEGAMK
jgi:hypothetical protein